MAIGSGLGASLGVAAESTYGTYVAPTRFLEIQSESLVETKNAIQGGGLAAGRFAQLGSRRTVVSRAGEGSVEVEVANRGFGLLLAHILGSSATPAQQGGSAAYLQAHTFGDNFGKSLTVQVGRPDTTGTVRPYSYLGGKVTAAEFSCGVDGQLTCTLDMDFREVSESQSLAAPSYSTSLFPFHFGQMDVKLGTYGAEASVTSVRQWSLRIERSMATDRYYAGTAGRKAEPIMNEWVAVSGSIESDFVDKQLFMDRFVSDASTSLVVEFVGANIASTYDRTIRFEMPMTFFDGGPHTVEGPDVLRSSFSYVVQSDGTNPLVAVDYQSEDTTL